MNSLAELLYQQNDPMMEDLMMSVASQTYINYHVTVFLNRQLEFFTIKFNIVPNMIVLVSSAMNLNDDLRAFNSITVMSLFHF